MHNNDLSGKTAIVTGASTGIGKASAQLLAGVGVNVVAGDINENDLAWTQQHSNIISCVADVATAEGNDSLVNTAQQQFGGLDIAVFNAGIAGNGALTRDSLARFDEIIAVNLRGVVLGMTAAIPLMNNGAMVVTASVSGLAGDPGMWAYNASKAGVINLVRAAALDLAAQGIRVNAVCPGPIRTAITADIEQAAPELFEGLRRHVPLQRWGEAQEVAEVIGFLSSSRASFITGAVIPVDGGISANTGQFPPAAF